MIIATDISSFYVKGVGVRKTDIQDISLAEVEGESHREAKDRRRASLYL